MGLEGDCYRFLLPQRPVLMEFHNGFFACFTAGHDTTRHDMTRQVSNVMQCNAMQFYKFTFQPFFAEYNIDGHKEILTTEQKLLMYICIYIHIYSFGRTEG